jgi:hypothetical protein
MTTMETVIDLGSVHPLDTGFDCRALEYPVILRLTPGNRYRIRYAEATVCGSPEDVCRVLADAGYLVVAAETPNGRLVRYEPGEFLIQPRNDNYWLSFPTLTEALAAY